MKLLLEILRDVSTHRRFWRPPRVAIVSPAHGGCKFSTGRFAWYQRLMSGRSTHDVSLRQAGVRRRRDNREPRQRAAGIERIARKILTKPPDLHDIPRFRGGTEQRLHK